MTDFSIRSESNPQFHLDIRSWPDSVVQLAIHADNTSHADLAKGVRSPDVEPGCALALQLNPTQIRELIDHLEPFAVERELTVFGVLDQTSDLCGSGDKSCPDFCCREIKEAGVAYLGDAVAKAPEQESILAEAEKVVNGPRAQFYGPPVVNFKRIADLWDAWLVGRPDRSAPISTYDVAYMMILMKLARLQHQPYHRDSVVDIAGYAGCAEKLARDLGDS